MSRSEGLVCGLGLSRLDYCNSLLAGCPSYLLTRLHKVHNHDLFSGLPNLLVSLFFILSFSPLVTSGKRINDSDSFSLSLSQEFVLPCVCLVCLLCHEFMKTCLLLLLWASATLLIISPSLAITCWKFSYRKIVSFEERIVSFQSSCWCNVLSFSICHSASRCFIKTSLKTSYFQLLNLLEVNLLSFL